MTRIELEEKVAEVIDNLVAMNPLELPHDKRNLIEDIGFDSLDSVEMVMDLEEEFGIDIPDEDADAFKTFGDVVDCVEQKVAEDGC